MQIFVRCLIFGYVLIFLASISFVAISLLHAHEPILIPKSRALCGLGVLLGITTAVFGGKNLEVIWVGLGSGFLLVFASLFFSGAHPMYQFAAVRHSNAAGFITSDEVYLRTAPSVKKFESEGGKKSKEGGWTGIERYLYSPRLGVLIGKSIGEGKGSPEYSYELSGVAAWFFGARAACETFAFYSINLTPLILVCGLFAFRGKVSPQESIPFEPVRALFLLGPLVVGLIPVLGP